MPNPYRYYILQNFVINIFKNVFINLAIDIDICDLDIDINIARMADIDIFKKY